MASAPARRRAPRSRPTPWTERYKGDRALSAAQIDQLVRALEAGASPTVLARELGVSRRTVYRWRHARIAMCRIEGWKALFVIRPIDSGVREGPVQLTPWQPDE